MGVALEAVGDTTKLLRHNTVLWAVGWPLALGFLFVTTILGLIPLVGPLLSIFVGPMFLVGILSMAYSGRNGNASVGDFAEGVVDNYLPYLASMLVLVAVAVVVGFVFAFLSVFMIPMGSRANPTASMAALVVTFGSMILFGLFFLAIQFFDVAIVVGDSGPISAFSKSVELLLSAPISVIGYTLLRALFGAVFFVVPLFLVLAVSGGLSAAAVSAGGTGMGTTPGFEAAGLTLLAGAAVYFLVFMPLGYVTLLSYHVAYFNRHEARGTV